MCEVGNRWARSQMLRSGLWLADESHWGLYANNVDWRSIWRQYEVCALEQGDFVVFLAFWLDGFIGFSKSGVFIETPGVSTEMAGVYTGNLNKWLKFVFCSFSFRVVSALAFLFSRFDYHSHLSLIQRQHHDTALTHVSRSLLSVSSTTFCPSFSFFPMATGSLVSWAWNINALGRSLMKPDLKNRLRVCGFVRNVFAQVVAVKTGNRILG